MLVFTILVFSTLRCILCCRLSHEEEELTTEESAAQYDAIAPSSEVVTDQNNSRRASPDSKAPAKDMSVREIGTLHDDKRERTLPEDFAGNLKWSFHVY